MPTGIVFTQVKMEEILEEKEQKNVNRGRLHFEVLMTDKLLYDYMIHHAYTHFSGILSVCFAALGFMFFAKTHEIMYLALAVLLVLYLPINLGYRAKVQMMNPVFKKPIIYDIDEDGIRISQDETVNMAEWGMCEKVISTRQSIVVYTGKNNATIFPRKVLGDELAAFLAMTAEHVGPKKMKVRY